MADFEPIFPKYGLKANPYFVEPLIIEGGAIPINDTFVGREKEIKELYRIFSIGGGQRCMVIGEAGIGKTTLVNYVRAKAKESSYFSPNCEIPIQNDWKVNNVIIATLQSLYMEIRTRGIKLQDGKLSNMLEDLFELSRIIKDSDTDLDSYIPTNTLQLMDLFKKITQQIIQAGYRAIIIQYNNLDNIEDPRHLSALLNNLRDFFLNPSTIFILIGDGFLPHMISFRSRLRQIFIFPEIRVFKFSYENIKKIIDMRIAYLRINDKVEVVKPHSEESLRLLYQLYDGNIRDILNSLSSSVNIDNVITLSAIKTKQILHNRAESMFLDNLSPTEKDILEHIIKNNPINNLALAKSLNKPPQNISKYLQKLLNIKAIKVHTVEGRNIYYKPSAEAMWLKLKVTSGELIKEQNAKQQKIIMLQKKLMEFQ